MGDHVTDGTRQQDATAAEAACRLAVYGTLALGRPNHHQMDGLAGRWLPGHVHGELVAAGWGASLGFPALTLSPAAPAVDVHVSESTDLPAHWARLDEFEGPGYERVLTTVHTGAGHVAAFIYVLRALRDDRTTRTVP